jgi:hypothetical protein
MEHLTVKAVATATDLGWFTAIAAVFGNVDRDGDRIIKGAFAASIDAWQRIGRTVPLHWNHSAGPRRHRRPCRAGFDGRDRPGARCRRSARP